jgi:putative methyltransferase (TIGR04325 family)
MNIKDFIPPVIKSVVKKTLKLESNKEYRNYAQALESCMRNAYQNVELCNMIAEKTAIYAAKLREKPYKVNPTNVVLLSVINQYLNIYSKKDLRILDFGGACGVHYFDAKRFIPKDVTLKWYIVETPQMIKSATDRRLYNDELEFISTVDEAKDKIDIIHSSSALQYVPDPYEFTNKIINIEADWLLFNRMMLHEHERDFITVQKSLLSANGPGKLPDGYSEKILSYPYTTISFQKFNSMVLYHNYKLDWIFEDLSGSLKIRNKQINGKGLLYMRNGL